MTDKWESVPGRVVANEIIAARAGWSRNLRQGEVLRLVDLEGRQAVDFLCYNAFDTRDRYNAATARQVDDFRDFIRLHYVSERRDSPFWRDVAASHPQVVTDRLAQWQRHIPRPEDFLRFPPGLEHLGLAHVQEQLYVPVLDGLGLLNRPAAQAEMAANPKARDLARKTHAALVAEYAAAARQCLPHRAWLQSL